MSGWFVIAITASAGGPISPKNTSGVESISSANAIRTVSQWRGIGASNANLHLPVRLEGVVVARDPAGKWLRISDETGVEEVRTDLRQNPPQIGERIVMRGTSAATTAFPDYPTESSLESTFATPSLVPYPHTSRLTGLVTPSTTGNYIFWISGDDVAALWLGTNSLPASKRKIAAADSWTSPLEWEKFPSQRSAPLRLTAGQSYYIEALQVNNQGEGHVAVAWQGPGIERSVIRGDFLSAAIPTEPGAVNPPDWIPGVIRRDEWRMLEIDLLASTKDLVASIDVPPAIVQAHLAPSGIDNPSNPRLVELGSGVPVGRDGEWIELGGTVSHVSQSGPF